MPCREPVADLYSLKRFTWRARDLRLILNLSANNAYVGFLPARSSMRYWAAAAVYTLCAVDLSPTSFFPALALTPAWETNAEAAAANGTVSCQNPRLDQSGGRDPGYWLLGRRAVVGDPTFKITLADMERWGSFARTHGSAQAQHESGRA